MAPHSSTVARKIPWMEEPGGLQSMGLHRLSSISLLESGMEQTAESKELGNKAE